MAITLVIDDKILEEAQDISKDKTPTEIVVEALKEYISYRKQLQILGLFDTIEYDDRYDYKLQRVQR